MPNKPPPLAEAAILGPTSNLHRRIEIFESDQVTHWQDGIQDDRLIDGSVSVDYSRDERRSFDLVLDNTDFGLEHKPGGLWYDKIIKIFCGVEYFDGTTWVRWETQVGVFMIDSVTESHFPYTVRVTGRDLTKKLLLSKISSAAYFVTTTSLEILVRQQMQQAGLFKWILPTTGKTLGKGFLYERGTSRWEIIKSVCEAFGYEVFFDAYGYLVMRDFQDPITAPIGYTFEAGDLGSLVSYDKTVNDSRLYNHVVVTGESGSSDAVPVMAEAKNNNPQSPTNITAIGDRVYIYSSSFITTTSQAQTLADKWLKIYGMEEYDINFEAICFPWLEAGDIIEFMDPRPSLGQPTRFLLSSISIPLGLGAMSADAKRVTVVS